MTSIGLAASDTTGTAAPPWTAGIIGGVFIAIARRPKHLHCVTTLIGRRAVSVSARAFDLDEIRLPHARTEDPLPSGRPLSLDVRRN